VLIISSEAVVYHPHILIIAAELFLALASGNSQLSSSGSAVSEPVYVLEWSMIKFEGYFQSSPQYNEYITVKAIFALAGNTSSHKRVPY